MTVSQILPITGQDQILDALEIRDTSDHLSSIADSTGFVPKTLIIHNSHNQIVTCQLQGAALVAFSNPIDIGSSFTVAATTDDYQTISDYFPFLRLKASFSTAPASGDITVFLEKVSG